MDREKLSQIKARNMMIKRVLTIEKNKTLMEAVKKMYITNVGAVLIVDEDKKLVGIFSERDILRRVIPKELNLKKTLISKAMTKGPVTVGPEESIVEVYKHMQSLNFRHIPVVEEGKLIGIVSIKDIAKAFMKLVETER